MLHPRTALVLSFAQRARRDADVGDCEHAAGVARELIYFAKRVPKADKKKVAKIVRATRTWVGGRCKKGSRIQ